MTPWLNDGDVRLYHGDALKILAEVPAGTVQTCVTSPPYWGLRDYGTGTWTGGDSDCDHQPPPKPDRKFTNGRGEGSGDEYAGSNLRSWTTRDAMPATCRCGARRVDDQLGLEATPDQYVDRLVGIFREVHRVLRDDGTLWLNLGDSYATGTGRNDTDDANLARRAAAFGTGTGAGTGPRLFTSMTHPTKPKDMVGIPWRVAFAFQADGWYLRSDIIWSKPNPMPESVTDRPTKAHEYLFLLSKQPRYFYDADAIREPYLPTSEGRYAYSKQDTGPGFHQPRRSDDREDRTQAMNPAGRNRRSVWEIATQPFPEAHFATYPEALVRPCILAGSKPGDTVLDPFVGSGTTALVARKHGRRCIGIDLSSEYLGIAARRLQQLSLLAEETA